MGAGRSASRKLSRADLTPKAFEVATRLAQGSNTAIRWTKYALNNRLRRRRPQRRWSQISTMSYCSCAYIVST